MLMRNFSVLESRNDNHGHFNGFPGGRNAGQEPVDHRRVREADDEFVDNLICTDGARYVRHLHIRREKLADKMIPVKRSDALVSGAADHGWYIGQMGSGGHRGHGRRKIAGQFRVYVLLEHIHHRLL
jgi:hypothetical protein